MIHFSTTVIDETRTDPFLNDFWIEVIKTKTKSNDSNNNNRKDKSSEIDGDDRQQKTGLDIPNSIPVKEDNWNKHEFNRERALRVCNAGEGLGYDFFINMDNIYFKTEVKSKSKIEVKTMEARYKYGMTLIGLSILNHDKRNKKHKIEVESEPIENKILEFTSAISPVLLPMIRALGDLELE